jgi:branched-chain amino acid transport system ATP-binding protein
MLLEIDAIDSFYGDFQALFDVSLDVAEGETVAIIGANGAGKSTLLASVAGSLRPTAGEVRFDGATVSRLPAHRRVPLGIALVPEGRRIFSGLTVEQNLRLGLAARRRNGGDPLAEAYDLFPMLRESRKRQAGVLSGGQQQQLAIGRALVAAPELLLLDEPSLGLAPAAVDAVFEALARIRERGVTILLVEQRAQRTVALADRTHVLVNGAQRLELSPADADDTDKLVAAYLSA